MQRSAARRIWWVAVSTAKFAHEYQQSLTFVYFNGFQTRCFDKNENNVFAENFFIKLECFKRLLELGEEVEGMGDSELKPLIENLKEDEELMRWIAAHNESQSK